LKKESLEEGQKENILSSKILKYKCKE